MSFKRSLLALIFPSILIMSGCGMPITQTAKTETAAAPNSPGNQGSSSTAGNSGSTGTPNVPAPPTGGSGTGSSLSTTSGSTGTPVVSAPTSSSSSLGTVTSSSNSSGAVSSNVQAGQTQETFQINGGVPATVGSGGTVVLLLSSPSSLPNHVVWSQTPSDPSFGQISSGGFYTAPSTEPTASYVTVTATDVDTSVTASLVISFAKFKPTITTISPSSIVAGTTVQVTITGTNLSASTKALFNGQEVAISLISSSSLTFNATTSVATTGNVPIVIQKDSNSLEEAVSSINVSAPPISYDAAARFLQQASWSPTPALIAHVQSVGFSAYLKEQFASQEDPYVTTDNFNQTTANLWMIAATHEQSQLRTKVSWAWYKLFASPGSTVNSISSAVPEITNRDAFGNFTSLLTDVSLNVEMGLFLNYVFTDGTSAEPDENFAREVMQAFSIGAINLNEDGTPQLDQNGATVPAYTQNDVRSIARAVTGLTYPGGDPFSQNDVEGLIPMVADAPGYHDSGTKVVLGTTLPSGLDAVTEIKQVITLLAAQPNTGRHLSAYLIHELVTSNPSAAYVKRVAAVWADNGHGVTGDIQAVVSAILLDDEARQLDDPSVEAPYDFGRMRDSVNFATTVIREFGVTPIGGVPLWGAANDFGHLSHEGAWDAPSVFGYYDDNYGLSGTTLRAPEAQLYTSDAISARAHFIAYIFGMPGIPNPVPSSVDWSQWSSLAVNDGGPLLDAINHLCFHGTMSAELRSTLQSNLQSLSGSDLVTRAQQTAYLAVMSPEFAVER